MQVSSGWAAAPLLARRLYTTILADSALCGRMKVQAMLPCLPPILLILSLHTNAEEHSEAGHGEEREDHDSARIFPLLPPYQSVDFAANFNKLKSSGDAAYFVVRDSTVVSFCCCCIMYFSNLLCYMFVY